MVGIIGVSNNQVSGMSIASLLFIAIAIKLSGFGGQVGIEKTLLVTVVVCVAISVAGATSQSLKTTFIIGGTPKSNQMIMWVGMMCCTVFATLKIDIGFGMNILPSVTQSNWLPFVMFLLLCLWFYFSSIKVGKEVSAKV